MYVTEVHVYDTWHVHVISVTNTPNNMKPASNLVMKKNVNCIEKRKYTTFGIQFRSVLQCQTVGNCWCSTSYQIKQNVDFSDTDEFGFRIVANQNNRKKAFKISFFISITRYKMRRIQNSNFRKHMRYCSYRFKLPRNKFQCFNVHFSIQ